MTGMRKFRNILFYIAIIGGFSLLMFWILQLGTGLESGDIASPDSGKSQWSNFTNALTISLKEPLAVLLLQIVTIILSARMLGWVCKKIGQPTVIGEMLAGIILGPSLM